MSGFTEQFLTEVVEVTRRLDRSSIEQAAAVLATIRSDGGRVFVLGVGGSAANASHAVNDLRKLAGIEAYAPTDNVSELTARTNDEGWATTFEAWLKISRLASRDAVLVLSVGGGNAGQNVSPNLVRALDHAKTVGARVLGIVGRDGGHTARVADACILIPVVNPDHVTPHTEAFQSVVLHLLVSHPLLKSNSAKWESMK
jgi:D-sedoheptulose 7-phosphate isomerase